MSTSRPLGPLESEVMEILWARDEATVRDVVEVLHRQRPIAYTTVMTIMNNLVQKGLLERASQGKAYLYRAALTKEAFRKRAFQQAISEVLERFNDVPMARFFGRDQISPDDLQRLRDLLADRGQPPRTEGDQK